MRAFLAALLLLAIVTPTPTRASSAACSTDPSSPSGLGVVEQAYRLLSAMYVDSLPASVLLTPALQAVHDELADGAAGVDPLRAPVVSWAGFADRYCAAWGLGPRPEPSEGLAHTAIRAMARAVDEGHSRFLTPRMYREHQEWASGNLRYEGIGTRIRSDPLAVQYVFPGSPAEQAGLAIGDRILAIDGRVADGLSPAEAAAIVRGEVGTRVRLTIQRPGSAEPRVLDIPRAVVRVPLIEAQLMGDVGYLRLYGFPTTDLTVEVADRLRAFRRDGARGLVLDLRGNGGGRLDVGTQVASYFLPENTAVYRQTTRRGQTTTMTVPNARIWDRPMVVLVDEGTASMGEILAAALQERSIAPVVGATTSGSVAGSVVVPLSDGSALQITTLRIDSGLGTRLNRIGVHPDVELSDEAREARPGLDRPLETALDLLRSQLADDRPPGVDSGSAPAAMTQGAGAAPTTH